MTVNSTVKHLQRHALPEYCNETRVAWRITGVLGSAADTLFHTLCNELAWQQPRLSLYGRHHPIPRLSCWLGERRVRYRYSGIDHCAAGWPPFLLPLLMRLQILTGRCPNGALANLYRNGNDTMGWHRDNEPELGSAPWVLSYSLGAERDLAFRPYGSTRQARVLPLRHDELLVMAPQAQYGFEHALPRRRRVQQARVNLTFREIQPRNR